MHRLSVVAVLTGVLLLGSSAMLLRASGDQGSARQAESGGTAAERFGRWLDAQAARALAEGARARGAAATAEDVRRRADATRRHVLDAMGGLPDARTPLNARVTGSFDRNGYRVEHLVFESLPGFFVTANLYVPTSGPGPYPAVLGTAGHSDAGKAHDVYQRAWIGLARRGIMVLAYDPPGQGERIEYFDASTGTSRIGIGTREHSHVGQQCLLTGTSVARYFAWDGIRALDYLQARPDVDPARVGVAGNSGGGTQAAWLAVVEPRLSAVVSSCYITSWSALWEGSGPQDMEQVLPGFLARGLDFADMIIAAAPRPYLVSSAVRDFFPIEGARATVAEARDAYALVGAADRVGHVEHDATHGWSQRLREAAYRWFGRWWLDSPGDADEGEINPEPVEQLRASSTGQVATSFRSRTIFDINSDRARELARTRPPATKERLRALLQIPDVLPDAKLARREQARATGGHRTERLELAVEAGVVLPALLIHPDGGPPRGTVLIADGREGEDNADAEATALRWAERGYLALALNARGTGALAPTRGESGYTSDYQLAARAWLLGTSVVAWQARDVLRGLGFLERELPATDVERVVHVAGLSAPAGLFAAALRRVNAVWVEDAFVSYADVATTRDYAAPARVFVPGVLEVTDLPELITLAAPAAVHLVRPVGADGQPLRDEAAVRERLGGTTPGNVRLDISGSSLE